MSITYFVQSVTKLNKLNKLIVVVLQQVNFILMVALDGCTVHIDNRNFFICPTNAHKLI